MKKCIGCGMETHGEEKVCMLCGYELKEANEVAQSSKMNNGVSIGKDESAGLFVRTIEKLTEIKESLIIVLMILVAIFSLNIVSKGQILLLTDHSSDKYVEGAVLNINSFSIDVVGLFSIAMFGSITALVGSIVSNDKKIFTTISMILCLGAVMVFVTIPGECFDLLFEGFVPLVSYTEDLEHYFGKYFSYSSIDLSVSGKMAFGGIIAYGLMHIYLFFKYRSSEKNTVSNT